MGSFDTDKIRPELGPLTSALLEYWEDARGDRPMPARADIDPIDIPRLLPFILLLQVDGVTRRVKIRLMGTRVRDLYGEEYTGRYLDEIYFGRNREQVLASYDEALESRAPHHCWMQFTNRDGLEFDMERLILPLSTDGKTVDMFISLLDIHPGVPH